MRATSKAGDNRLLTRWPRSEQLARGWRIGARIEIVSSLLGPPIPESPPLGRGDLPFFPPAPHSLVMQFGVILGEPDAASDLRAEGMLVGRILLLSGMAVWVLGRAVETTPDLHARIEVIRQSFLLSRPKGAARADRVHGWAWNGESEGVPTLIDVSIAVPRQEP
jgi:hypothetical protein